MPSPLDELRLLSSRLGGDSRLVQAAGGNTSLKGRGTLHIKASGTWLADALTREIFVPVDLARIRAAMARGQDDLPPHTLTNGLTLRPSVETSMHALLPHRVVVHVHSVNTLAWAVRADARERLGERLAGLRWAWVPYVHPGLPLTQAIAEVTGGGQADVIVLGNHGLVIGSEDCERAEKLLNDVERRLWREPRTTPEPDATQLRSIAPMGWHPATPPWLHGLGTDEFACRLASGGTLYPDHCVFLGPAAAAMEVGESLPAAAARHERRHQWSPEVMLVRGAGVLTKWV